MARELSLTRASACLALLFFAAAAASDDHAAAARTAAAMAKAAKPHTKAATKTVRKVAAAGVHAVAQASAAHKKTARKVAPKPNAKAPAGIPHKKALAGARAARSAHARRLDVQTGTTTCYWDTDNGECGPSGYSFIADVIEIRGIPTSSKQHKLWDTMSECSSLTTDETCSANADCQWHGDDGCEADIALFYQVPADGEMCDPSSGSGSGWSEYGTLLSTCEKLDSAEACSGTENCEWHADDSSCGIADNYVYTTAVANSANGTGGGLMAIGMQGTTCEAMSSESACAGTENCEWSLDDDSGQMECGVSEAYAMEMLFGDGGDSTTGLGLMAIGMQGTTCEAVSSESACAGTENCEWSLDDDSGQMECGVSEAYVMTIMMDGGGDSTGAGLMAIEMQGTTCEAVSSESACAGTENCEWEQNEESGQMECGVSEAYEMTIMMDVEMAIMTQAATCEAVSSESACHGTENCEWKQNEESGQMECGVSFVYAFTTMMFGDTSGDSLMAIMMLGMTCDTASSESACSGTKNCEWSLDDDSGQMECGVSEAYSMQLLLAGLEEGGPMAQASQCAGLEESACTGSCEWDGSDCNPGNLLMLTAAFGEIPTCKSMLMLYHEVDAECSAAGSIDACEAKDGCMAGEGSCEVDMEALYGRTMSEETLSIVNGVIDTCGGYTDKDACNNATAMYTFEPNPAARPWAVLLAAAAAAAGTALLA